VSPPPPPAPHERTLLDPFTLGTACGLASAVIYTAANSFLRAVSDCDPVWVSAVKAVPTVLFMTPWLVILARRGQRLYPNWRIVAMTAAAGLGGQLVGNVSFQWGLGQVGLALTASLNLGGMIVFAAILGRVFLHEPVTPRAAISLSFLLAAIAVLSLGAGDAHRSVTEMAPTWTQIAAGVGAGCLSGLAYAILNVVIRYGVVRGMPLPSTLFLVSAVGMLSLGSVSWLRVGGAQMAATTPHHLAMMLLAGVCNALAFMALTKSLQLTSVVYVNALNATQATLAALAGILIFEEALSPWLLAGVGLTIVGLLLLMRTRQAVVVSEA
jgi:drug/metabolite transporter (DMT)-like permease